MSISIREAVRGDAPAILQLVKALAEYEKEPQAVDMTEDMAAHALEHKHMRALLAFDDGQAVAIAIYFFNFSTWTGRRGLYLEDLFVVPEARKLGVGLKLLQELAAIAVAKDCGRMEWALLDWNDHAKGFYRLLGASHAEGWELWRLKGDALRTLAAS